MQDEGGARHERILEGRESRGEGAGQATRVLGIILGLGIAFAVTRSFANLLVGVTPTDPATFGSVALLLSAVAILACVVPAQQAARVDPTVALHSE